MSLYVFIIFVIILWRHTIFATLTHKLHWHALNYTFTLLLMIYIFSFPSFPRSSRTRCGPPSGRLVPALTHWAAWTLFPQTATSIWCRSLTPKTLPQPARLSASALDAKTLFLAWTQTKVVLMGIHPLSAVDMSLKFLNQASLSIMTILLNPQSLVIIFTTYHLCPFNSWVTSHNNPQWVICF